MPDQRANDLGLEVVEQIPALRRYARTLKTTADQADDLVQDTVERALGRMALFQPGTNLRAWLFTLMRNIAITQARKAALRRKYALELIAMERQSMSPSQIDTVLVKRSLAQIGALSAGEREAVTMLGVQDLTYEEAAAATGLPVGTMKSRLSRGRSRLREMLDGGPADDAARA
jgi:RNA polymerase sigma-70 factor (ECF subfamily)